MKSRAMLMSLIPHVSALLLVALIPPVEAENPKSTTAVSKVLEMLGEIHKKSEDQLFQEQMTYTKFERFCNDTKEEKAASIEENEVKQKTLTATVKTKDASIDELTGKIDDLEKDIADDKSEIAKLTSDRKAARAAYGKNAEDLSTAIEALTKGIDGLKAAKKPSFLQLRGGTQKPPAALAHFLGLKDGAASTLIATASRSMQSDDSHLKGYDFDLSNGLSGTLWGILKNMRSAKDNADQEEAKAENTFMLAVQTAEQTMARHKRTMEAHNRQQSEDKEAKAVAENNLKLIQAALQEDGTYLADTKAMCADKKAAWLARKITREDEIKVLGSATTIMKEGMTINASQGKTQSMSQLLAEVERSFGSREDMLRAAEAAAESAEASNPVPKHAPKTGLIQLYSFLPKSDYDTKLKHQDVLRQLMALLRRKSIELQSPVLLSIVRSVNGTALDSVKSKLSELITDLSSKSEDKLVKCEKDRASLETQLNDSSVQVFKENSRLAAAEADHAELAATKARLTKELAGLADSKEKASAIRAEEAAEAAHAIEEATQGKKAVETAKDVLGNFYGGKQKGTAAKPQELKGSSVTKDAPDAGFDSDMAYEGSGASGTVLGMLDIILDDFKQTLDETVSDEAKAKKEYSAFESDTDRDKGAKEAELTATGKAMSDLDRDLTALQNAAGVLKNRLEQLADLEKLCSVGAVAEDRIAKRRAEMDALKEAIEYLDSVIPGLEGTR
eukprot:TRINITY_DN22176_c0_g1_i1.p1 TRINITY_DN22176_c0_g1~~TRINITY_DN22176_c0_g1_i1.p1  ORF type:complete len:732 (+),score=229.28 TRINITY_DN22176_c0_g1_i1:44-2239(+)